MRRTIFVNRFYWPEHTATAQLLTDLAEALAGDGRAVTVITSRPATGNVAARAVRRGVEILRLRSPRGATDAVLHKAAAFAAFYVTAGWTLFRQVRRGDTVVAMTDPPLIGIAVAGICALKGAHAIHWVQDIYPEVAVAVSGQGVLGLLRPLRNLGWRSAEHCVTLGSEMAAVIARAGVPSKRISVVPNWAPVGVAVNGAPVSTNELRSAWNLGGNFVAAYSGNLGRVHDLETILGAAALLRDAPVTFLFIGGGAQRQWLESQVKQHGLTNVRLVAAQPREKLGATLAVGDIHLVTLRAGCEAYVFPSKIYGIAAAGRATLFVGPPHSDPARLIEQANLGCVIPAGDARQLADLIVNLAGAPPRLSAYREAAQHFAATNTAATAAGRWRDVLARIEA